MEFKPLTEQVRVEAYKVHSLLQRLDHLLYQAHHLLTYVLLDSLQAADSSIPSYLGRLQSEKWSV